MRVDSNGEACPSTLGEYLDLVKAIVGRKLVENSETVLFLEKKILQAPNGRDEEVIAPDEHMRGLLLPMLFRDTLNAKPMKGEELKEYQDTVQAELDKLEEVKRTNLN